MLLGCVEPFWWLCHVLEAQAPGRSTQPASRPPPPGPRGPATAPTAQPCPNPGTAEGSVSGPQREWDGVGTGKWDQLGAWQRGHPHALEKLAGWV